MTKQYITTKGVQDKLWCDLHYPHPVYFDRPTERMPKRELQAMLHERAEEAKRIIEMMESMADAKVENERLRDYINALHDLHNAFRFFTAVGSGRPHLWEV